MIEYRSFRNDDPPALAEIWSDQAPLRAMLQPMSASTLERLVMSKPYFDRHGLVVAVDDQRPVGFVHAGFGPSEDGSRVDSSVGVTCVLLVAAHQQRQLIAHELLARSEQYLTGRGARTLYAGGVQCIAPYYHGLYGGSALPGVLDGDELFLEACLASHYVSAGNRRILQLELARYRPVVDRLQMQIRRSYQAEPVLDPPPETWWEACTYGLAERTRFVAVPRVHGEAGGSMTFWNMEPMSSSWGIHANGLIQVSIAADHQRDAMTMFLLNESLRMLAADGATLVEVQIGDDQNDLLQLFSKIGFEQADHGTVFCKHVPGGT